MGFAAARLSEAEIARRLPLWVAMSELFLDTEPDSKDYISIAELIEEIDYTACEAETIFMNDVAPAFLANLLSVAGEWQGWSESFVRERVLAKRGARLEKMFSRLLHGKMLTDEWAKIAAYLPC
jgi:hypothetical protein